MRVLRIACLVVALGAAAAPAAADLIVLRNGRKLTGKIVSETPQEIVIEIGDGMQMKVRKTRIERIERSEEEPEKPAPAEEPAPEPVPEPEPAPPKKPEAPVKKTPGSRGVQHFFAGSAADAWRGAFGRYPEIIASRTKRFRAYELVERAPLRLGADHPAVRQAVAEHGHGGTISLWKFKYVGVRDLAYGDKVKFIGEITAPPDTDPPLISFEQGPTDSADRVVVLLVWTKNGIERYATTTVFTGQDFRQTVLMKLDDVRIPVRVYDRDYALHGTAWMTPGETKFLDGLASPFGESPLVRISRYRFRLEWLRTPPAKRPPLDAALIEQNVVRPIAAEGRPAASEEYVRKMWGTEELVEKRLAEEIERVRADLASIGVKPGAEYYVEQDRVGTFGSKGVTIETRRLRLSKALIDDLTRP